MFSIAIIVPTSGTQRSMYRTLESVANQQHSNVEVIVIQNGSAGVLELNACYGARLVSLPETGLLAARHTGVKETSAEILVFVDDDIVASDGWLNAIAECFTDPRVHLVGGPSFPEFECRPPIWLDQFYCDFGTGIVGCPWLSLLDGGGVRREIRADLIWGLNFAIRRTTLEAVGGFHPDGYPWELRRYRGDGETAVSHALTEGSFKAIYEPKAAVTHLISASRLELPYFERRAYMQGISDSYSDLRSSPAKSGRISGMTWTRNLVAFASGSMNYFLASPEKKRVLNAYKQGYRYHQSEYAKDNLLRSWVSQPDYWDIDSPEKLLRQDLHGNHKES
jgi:glycosyltransferase involved in cell wall biosynthesis